MKTLIIPSSVDIIRPEIAVLYESWLDRQVLIGGKKRRIVLPLPFSRNSLSMVTGQIAEAQDECHGALAGQDAVRRDVQNKQRNDEMGEVLADLVVQTAEPWNRALMELLVRSRRRYAEGLWWLATSESKGFNLEAAQALVSFEMKERAVTALLLEAKDQEVQAWLWRHLLSLPCHASSLFWLALNESCCQENAVNEVGVRYLCFDGRDLSEKLLYLIACHHLPGEALTALRQFLLMHLRDKDGITTVRHAIALNKSGYVASVLSQELEKRLAKDRSSVTQKRGAKHAS